MRAQAVLLELENKRFEQDKLMCYEDCLSKERFKECVILKEEINKMQTKLD